MPANFRSAISRALAASVWPAALAAVLLVAGARWLVPIPLDGPVAEAGWTRRSRAAFVPHDFHPAELDTATGRSFSWTRQQSSLEFPALQRARAHRVTLRVRGGRPPDRPPTDVSIFVDRQLRQRVSVPGHSSEIAFEIPRGDGRGATVTIEVTEPYVPGGADPRALGVIVDNVAVTPVNGAFAPSGRAVGAIALSVFLAVLGLRACGLRGWLGTVTSLGVVVGAAWLLLTDAAFLGQDFGLLKIATGGAIIGASIGALRLKWPAWGGAPEWSIAAGLILAVSIFKLGVFWHPLAIVGDGIFQVHRAQVVHGGQLFFTSVTPKPFFEFPYPVALYVFAQPFWNWFPTELDLLRLLRTVAVFADGVTGLMLYGAVRRQWDNGAAALITAALWPFATAPLQALSNANLTNLFGQSVFGAGLAALAWIGAASSRSIVALAGAAALLAIGFLSHFGTVTVGLAILGAVGTLLLVAGDRPMRMHGLRVFGGLAVALALAWFVYYSHSTFRPVYRQTWTAVAERQNDDSSKMVAAPSVKLERWWSGTGDDYGRPGLVVLLTAAAGAGLLVRSRRSAAGLVFLGWLLAWVALSVLGILTPFTLRANLATAPVFVALSAIALGALASRARAGRLAAIVVGVLIAWDGLRILTACLQLATHN